MTMRSSRKNSYPPQGRSSEIPRDGVGGGGGVVLKPSILEAKYGAKLEFSGGRACKTKNLPWEGVWTLSGTAQ